MPTVFREGPYRFFFYAGDKDEPPHVHVEWDDKIAKFWLDPLRLCNSGRFARAELGEIEGILRRAGNVCLEAWNDYFNG